jgi:hypothetical protein
MLLVTGGVLAQVTEETRAKVQKLADSDPAFAKRMDKYYWQCLDGTDKSPDCEELVLGLYKNFIRKKELDAVGRMTAARKALTIEAEFAFGLVQLGDYVRTEVLPSSGFDYIQRITTNPSATDEVRALVARVREAGRASPEDRERLLAAIRASNARYDSLIASAPDGILDLKDGYYRREQAEQHQSYARIQKWLKTPG